MRDTTTQQERERNGWDAAMEMTRRLDEHKTHLAEQFKVLWSMTPAQCVAAMYNGELTWRQLCHWAKHAPREVPTLNGEFWFIAIATPEVVERSR